MAYGEVRCNYGEALGMAPAREAEDRVEVVRAPGFELLEMQPQPPSAYFHALPKLLVRVVPRAVLREHSHAANLGKRLLQYFEPLQIKLRKGDSHSSDVAAGCARLSAQPSRTASPPEIVTMGMELVALLAASRGPGPPARMTSTFSSFQPEPWTAISPSPSWAP